MPDTGFGEGEYGEGEYGEPGTPSPTGFGKGAFGTGRPFGEAGTAPSPTGFGEGAFGEGSYGEPTTPPASGYGTGSYGTGPYGRPSIPITSGHGSGAFGKGPYGVQAPPPPASGYGAGLYGASVYGQPLTPVSSGYGSGAFGAGAYGGPATPVPPKFTMLPDAMPDIKQWLHDQPYLNALHEGRVFFRLPKKVKRVPFMRIYRSGGGRQMNSEVPMMDIRVALEVWGLEGSDYDAVRGLCNAIESLTTEIPPGTILGDTGTVVTNVNISTFFDSPDPDTGMPRMVGDSVWTVKPG